MRVDLIYWFFKAVPGLVIGVGERLLKMGSRVLFSKSWMQEWELWGDSLSRYEGWHVSSVLGLQNE